MKIKPQALLCAAKGEGFTGKEDDYAGMKKHLSDLGVDIADAQGNTCKAADLDVDLPGKTIHIDMAPEPKKSAEDLAPDFNAKVAAMVEAEMKKLGVSKGPDGRPKLITADEVTVKSGHQLRWEDDKARGERKAFRTWDMALAYKEHLVSQLQHMWGSENASKARERFNQICNTKGYVTTTQAGGGALVPEQFVPDILNLVKDFGVARKVCRVISMESDKVIRPKVTGAHTVHYPNEAGALTQSQQTWSNITLNAKTGHVLIRFSLQVIDDAAVDIVGHATMEAARAIAKIEDDSLFNGNGNGQASGYIPDVRGVTNLNDDSADGSRTEIGAGTADAHTLTQLMAAMGTVPSWAKMNAKWHCANEMQAIVLLRLAQSQGGATLQDFAGYGVLPMVLGYPVVANNSMNSANNASANTTDVIFGDMALAAMLGDRMGITTAMSNERYFDTYEAGLRVSVRHDINVHDLGSSTTQGPLGFLKQS